MTNAQPSRAAPSRALYTMPIRDLFARVLWGEARGDGRVGMQAVANVILNRARHPRWWGEDVRGVCLKPYQFSCLLQNDPNFPKLLDVTASDPDFRDALALADAALTGTLADITAGSDHYVMTSWVARTVWTVNHTAVAVIGHHSFYRLELHPVA